MTDRRPETGITLRQSALSRLLIVLLPIISLASSASGQDAVALITDVRLVDTIDGQDIELLSSAAPKSFRPERAEGCTFAVLLPDLVPGPEIAGQFFASDLIERLTLRTVKGEATATRVCVKATEPVRSRIALRAGGMTLRLERTRESGAAMETGETFHTLDESSGARPTGPTTSSSIGPEGGAAAESKRGPTANREMELALREARVTERELKLELGSLESRLEEQVAANAVLDQQLSLRQGDADQLVPRIERLLHALAVDGNALEQPVERFDAALAALDRRIADFSTTVEDYSELRSASEELVSLLANGASTLVATNDDVNVRLAPSTQAERIAFLPKGVLLQVKERRAGWSLVTAGEFEGWIFNQLLTAAGHRTESAEVPNGAAGDRNAAGLGWAAERVRALQRELGLATERMAGDEQRLREFGQRQAALELTAGGVEELTKTNATLRVELESAQSDLVAAQQENQTLGDLLSGREREIVTLTEQLKRTEEAVHGEPTDGASSGDSQGDEAALRSRLVALASLASSDHATVITTDQTNLRSAPGTANERLALLPRNFELAFLGENNGWYEVAYGRLRGWVSAAYSRVQRNPDLSIGTESTDSLLAVIEQYLANYDNDYDNARAVGVEAPLVLADSQGAGHTSQPSEPGPPSALLQSAADALYAHAAAARRGDFETYLSFYSTRFAPQSGTREEWEKGLHESFSRGLMADLTFQNLALRTVSEGLVEARFSPLAEVGGCSRMDLVRESDGWQVLMETTAP